MPRPVGSYSDSPFSELLGLGLSLLESLLGSLVAQKGVYPEPMGVQASCCSADGPTSPSPPADRVERTASGRVLQPSEIIARDAERKLAAEQAGEQADEQLETLFRIGSVNSHGTSSPATPPRA